MILPQFRAQVRKDVDEFVPFIEKLNKEFPGNAATDLGEADWFEQFSMFVESRKR